MGELWWSRECKKHTQDQQWYFFVAEWRVKLRSPATQWGAFTTPPSFLCKPARVGLRDNTPNPVAPAIPQRAKQCPESVAGLLKCRSETHHTHLLQKDKHTVNSWSVPPPSKAWKANIWLQRKLQRAHGNHLKTALSFSSGPERSDHPLQHRSYVPCTWWSVREEFISPNSDADKVELATLRFVNRWYLRRHLSDLL